jgi:hypothetical protein
MHELRALSLPQNCKVAQVVHHSVPKIAFSSNQTLLEAPGLKLPYDLTPDTTVCLTIVDAQFHRKHQVVVNISFSV